MSHDMPNNLNKRLNLILKDYISPFLREFGFRKKKLNYSCAINEVKWLINVQRSKFNDQSKSEFTLNVGVYVPGVWSTYATYEKAKIEPLNPTLRECSFHERIAVLTNEKEDIWWKLRADDSDEVDNEIAQDLLDKIKNAAIPFFNKFNSSLEVAEFLSSDLSKEYKYVHPLAKSVRLAYAGIIYFNLGEKGKAEQILDFAIEAANAEASKRFPNDGFIEDLKHRVFG